MKERKHFWKSGRDNLKGSKISSHRMAKNLKTEAKEPELHAAGLRFAVVVSRFNKLITERLLRGAVDALGKSGAAKADIEIVEVPGAFELPLAAKKLAAKGEYDALIAIGGGIRGETSH